MGGQLSPLFMRIRKRKLLISAAPSLLHQPHATSACPKKQSFWSILHVQEDTGQGVFSCVENFRCKNVPGAPWYLWVLAKGCLYPY